jgi:hypothetical protein
MITVTVSDDFPTSITSSFTLSVTNVAPKVVTGLNDVQLKHGLSLNIPLAKNFTDDDGDTIKMTATYRYNGGNAMPIPGISGGIFTMPSEFQIYVASTSITDTGSYAITVTVYDNFPSNLTASFNLIITNTAPKVVTAPKDLTIKHGLSLNIPLAKNFTDDDGDIISMTATYTRIGGTVVTIPNGLFTVIPSALTIDISSKSITEIGVYTITLTI